MQRRAGRPLSLAAVGLWALVAACLRAALPFVAAARALGPPGMLRAEGLPPAPQPSGGLPRPSMPAGRGPAGAVACAASAVLLLQFGARRRGRRSSGHAGRRAEDPTAPENNSLLANLAASDQSPDAEAVKTERQMAKGDINLAALQGQVFTDDDIDESAEIQEESAEELARRGARQVVYNLYPSNQYVLYIAKKNAEKTWAKDSFAGPKMNHGCLEVQIAILTERIRNSVLHIREFKHDYLTRLKLVQLVARRRRYLDKLSWKDLDSYIKIREALKIRHVYRMEALIGRLPAYKYTMRDRKRAPGRKVAMRLKKTKRLLARRLASQLRQGKPKNIIHRTKTRIASRQWAARSYDDAANLISGRPVTSFIDPLNVP